MKYYLNIANAASTLIAELSSAIQTAKQEVSRMEAVEKAGGDRVLFNREYDNALVAAECYLRIRANAIAYLTADPLNGPTKAQVSEFVSAVFKLRINLEQYDYRYVLWNRIIDDVLSEWPSSRVMQGYKQDEKFIKNYLIPHGLAYTI